MLRKSRGRRQGRRVEQRPVGVVVGEDRLRGVDVLAVESARRRCRCRCSYPGFHLRPAWSRPRGTRRRSCRQRATCRRAASSARSGRTGSRRTSHRWRSPTRNAAVVDDGATAVRRSLVMRSAIVCASPSAVKRSVVFDGLVLHHHDRAERGREHDRQQRGRDHELDERVATLGADAALFATCSRSAIMRPTIVIGLE